jgi:hypothetical protein
MAGRASIEDNGRSALTTAGSGNSAGSSGSSNGGGKVDWKKFIVTKRSSFGLEVSIIFCFQYNNAYIPSHVYHLMFTATSLYTLAIQADELASDGEYEIAAPRPTKDIESNLMATSNAIASSSGSSGGVSNGGGNGGSGVVVSEFDF